MVSKKIKRVPVDISVGYDWKKNRAVFVAVANDGSMWCSSGSPKNGGGWAVMPDLPQDYPIDPEPQPPIPMPEPLEDESDTTVKPVILAPCANCGGKSLEQGAGPYMRCRECGVTRLKIVIP